MTKKKLISGGLISIIFIGFLGAANFAFNQKRAFEKIWSESNHLNLEIKNLQEDITFFNSHKKEINFLISKGWLAPISRLIAADKIKEVQGNLKELHVTFEPETTINLGSPYTYKTSKIVIIFTSDFEKDIYIFIEKLIDEFPGILMFHELILSENEKSEGQTEALMLGQLTLNWISMDRGSYEK